MLDLVAASLPAIWQTWGQMAESCELTVHGVRAAAGDALNFHTAVVICAVIVMLGTTRIWTPAVRVSPPPLRH